MMKPLRIAFGIRLKELRKGKGLTQEQLAEKVGISVDFLSLIERGVNAPSFETVEKLTQALSVRAKDLFDFEKKESKT